MKRTFPRRRDGTGGTGRGGRGRPDMLFVGPDRAGPRPVTPSTLADPRGPLWVDDAAMAVVSYAAAPLVIGAWLTAVWYRLMCRMASANA